MEEKMEMESKKRTEYLLEWNGEKKEIGDSYSMKDLLDNLVKLGYKEFIISVKEI